MSAPTLGVLYSTMPNVPISGIYAIVNSVTGGFYIGSSVNLATRKRNHFTDLRCGVHCNAHLQSSWNKHGAGAFRWEVLAIIAADQTLATEGRILARLFGHPQCYNIVREAVSGLTKRQMSTEMRARALRANVGRKQSPESNARRSAATRGRKRDPALVARTAEGNRGKKRTPEQRAKFATVATPEQLAKMSAAKKGTRQSPETVAKRSAAMKAIWSDPEYRARTLGARKPPTPEAIAKRVAATTGQKRSEEVRARLAEICRRNGEACRGKKQTPEHVAKRIAWRGGVE